uniref:BRCA1-associated protein n=1 Tax=Steinernema glaseri TaxID=37863 RepID=A0A1I7YDR7_9BILA
MLADVIPILIKLEIVKGAPFVDISPSNVPNDKSGQIPSIPVRNMPQPRRSKKSTSRSETSAGAPLAPPVKQVATTNVALDKNACMGRRTYSEVVVETVKPHASSYRTTGDISCSSQSSRCSSEPATLVEKIAYYCGNPTVEKTTGLLHFYKKKFAEMLRKFVPNCSIFNLATMMLFSVRTSLCCAC